MTIHVVSTFQEKASGEIGYIIGCDSLVEREGISYWSDKGFVGESYVGVWMGSMVDGMPSVDDCKELILIASGMKSGDKETVMRCATQRELGQAFGEISEGSDYSHQHILRHIDELQGEYTLLIGKRNPELIELFFLTNRRSFANSGHIARRLHSLRLEDTLNQRDLWFAGSGVPVQDTPYLHFHMERSVSLGEARKLVLGFLTEKSEILSGDQAYTPGMPNLYIASSSRCGRLEQKIT